MARLWEEPRRYAEQSEGRIQDVRRKDIHLQGLFTARVTATTDPTRGTNTDTNTTGGEWWCWSIFLTTLKKIIEVNEVAQERWPFQLAPQLTGKTQQAHAALITEHTKDYDAVKTAILRQYKH